MAEQHIHAHHEHVFGLDEQQAGERPTYWVVVLTFITMVVELIAGTMTGSMALTADGWHMSTHAAALGIAAFAYRFARNHATDPRFTFGTGKVTTLGGFASAIALTMVAVLMVAESVERLISPVTVAFREAMIVAVIGLLVNLASAWMLSRAGHHHHHGLFGHDDHDDHQHGHDDHDDHGHDHPHEDDHDHPHPHEAAHDHPHPHEAAHDHPHPHEAAHDHPHPHEAAHDHPHPHEAAHPHPHPHDDDHAQAGKVEKQDYNLKAAYLHVLADALTSVTAIFALATGYFFGWVWMDPLMGVVGSMVILVWAKGLLKESGAVLLDAEENDHRRKEILDRMQRGGDRVNDIHLWRVGPASHACIVSVATSSALSADAYKIRLKTIAGLDHITVEVNRCGVCANGTCV